MFNNKTLWVAVIVVAIIAIAGWSLPSMTPNQNLSGDTNFDSLDVSDGYKVDGTTVINGSGVVTGTTQTLSGYLTLNGGVVYSSTFATSSAGAATYTAANITGINTILHNATGALTATLPATSTLTSFVPNTGDRESITLVNIGSGAITFAAGTGMNLYNASSTLVLPPTAAAQFEFVRQADTDISVLYVPGS